MKRREFITLLGGVLGATWPHTVRAQQTEGMKRIGVIIGSTTPENLARISAFERALQLSGWQKDGNVQIDYRWSEADPERILSNATEIVALQPDVILAQATPTVAALLKITQTIPIIFVHVSDPIGSGFVGSFARPGGNVTGFIDIEPSIAGKWVQLLKEVAPALKRAAILFNPQTAPGQGSFFLEPFEKAASSLGLIPVRAEVQDIHAIEAALTSLASQPGGGLVVMPEAFVATHSDEVIALAERLRLPAVYPYRYFTARGGIMSYGIHPTDLFRRAGEYVDRILRGEKPADLPVQAPSRFELVINLKTARALGLTLPPTLLARADEVIE